MNSVITDVTQLEKYMECIKEPCVVKFSAEWCGPCHRLTPVFKELSSQFSDVQIKFYDINIEKSTKITNYENIQAIPLIIFYNNGTKIDSLTVSGFNPNLLRDNLEIFVSDVYTEKSNNDTGEDVKHEVVDEIVIEDEINNPQNSSFSKEDTFVL